MASTDTSKRETSRASLFLSYSSEDRPFAEKLRERLTRYIQVFLDAESIPGGTEWEREIEKGIRNCTIFVPIVSAASNNSRWVARETLLALQIVVPILPLLLSDSLPLRLVDRQFVDFREQFESGQSDFLLALADHVGPLRSSPEVIDRLIARAIRARLRGDMREANALVEQFVGNDCELASSGVVFWRKLETALATDLAETIGPRLVIKEESSQMSYREYNDRNAFLWTLELHGTDNHLAMIDAVTYTLHPTFPNRVQKVRSSEDHFRIQRVGWGVFKVQIHIEFVDYTAYDGSYMLTFAKTNKAPLAAF